MNEQRQTVLILYDDDAVRESLTDFFKDRGWRVLPAATAEEALNLLAYETPNGSVVDSRLPGMDGNKFIHEVCQRNIAMAYVLCTGSPEYHPPDNVATLPLVSEQVFTKPVTNLAKLEDTLRQQIERCNLREENNDE